jgi:hypothetical protein
MKQSGRFRVHNKTGWHWLLVFVLLGQAAIPLQAHTSLATNAAGQVVVICTWQGQRVERLPHGDNDQATADQWSPAVVFSQLLASAATSGQAKVTQASYLPLGTSTPIPRCGCASAVLTSCSIRAPPVSSLSV